METFIADLIHNPKIPKWVRYIMVTVVCGFAMLLGVALALKSPLPVGKIFGGVLSVLSFAAAVHLSVRIAKA